jgi:hypothetical protein
MKNSFTYLFLLMMISLLTYSCAKETVEPITTGALKGHVQNSKTGKAIPNASVSTNLGTNAILTDKKGDFSLRSIPTGSYTVEVEKEGFKSKLVHVTVKDNQTASAQILLSPEDNEPASAFIKAKVTSYFNTVHHDTTANTDSTFVEVNYLVKNISSNRSVPRFQVYFEIKTDNTTFYAQVNGDSLESGQEDVGHLSKYTRKYPAKSVNIFKIWAPTGS